MSMRVEEEIVIGKMDKVKRSKKKKSSDFENVTDSTSVETMGVDNNLNSREGKKRKNKKIHVIGGDIKLDSGCDEAVNAEGYLKLDEGNQREKLQKNKNKRKVKCGGEITDYSDAAVAVEAGGKEDKKLKSKRKHQVVGDTIVDGTLNETLRKYNNVEVDDGQKDKDQKKKKAKKRKLDSGEDKDNLNDKAQTDGKEKRISQTNDGVDGGHASELKQRKDKEKRNEEKKEEGNDEVRKGNKSFEKEDINESENTDIGARRKKNKKRMQENKDLNFEGDEKTKDGKEIENPSKDCDKDSLEKVERKTRKSKKNKDKDGLGIRLENKMIKKRGNGSTVVKVNDFVDSEGNAHLELNQTQNSEATNGIISRRKKSKSVENGSENPKPKGSSKKVKFSGHIEVFPSSDDNGAGKEKEEDTLLRGKRFSREEDEIVKEAVLNYIEAHGLGEEGLKMVLNCRSHPEIKNCWKDIGAALPYRPYTAVYYRAHILFERDEKHEWTAEDFELIRKFQEKHGNNWKVLADDLGKHRIHVKDTWRRIKLLNRNKGQWSQEEYQNLFDLVNIDLRVKVSEEKISKHGMLRDNICWGAISDKLSTRSNSTCCMKWYKQLTSSMVADGIWADSDDYRLVDALFKLDECCIEDVDWDNLLEHRSGDVCRERWDQMVRHIGLHGNKSFAEQVEILAQRYCPELLEAREAWESKPIVP